MFIIFRSILLVTFLWSALISYRCDAGNMRVTSVDLERPVVEYFNNTFGRLFNITSRRVSRQDPLHYIRACFETNVTLGNNVTVDVRIDEFLSNSYRPTFTVTSLKLCNFIQMATRNIFYARIESEPLKEIIINNDECVVQAGVYDVRNIAWPLRSVPENFPFSKGRFYLKFRLGGSDILSLYFDMEMKMLPKMRCRREC